MKTHLVSSCFFHHSLEIFTAKIETAIPVKIPATDIRVADILEAHRLKQPFSKQEVQDRPKGAKDIPQKVVQLLQILIIDVSYEYISCKCENFGQDVAFDDFLLLLKLRLTDWLQISRVN